jgi:hypothetical protein
VLAGVNGGTLATLAAIPGLLIALLAARHRRRSRAGGAAAPAVAPGSAPRPVGHITVETNIPTFNVIALGGQETGKTALLASMYHRLSTELRDGGFRIQTSLDHAVHLNGLYSTLRDPTGDWPPGTLLGETRSFGFDCLGWADATEHPVFRFNYLDYAGELVGGGHRTAASLGEQEDKQRDLEERVGAAHAVFGIIDGLRMVEFLRGEPRGLLYLENSINPMIGVMRKARCPVHFLLTKWDLFDAVETLDGLDENARLAAVRKELLAQAPIYNLVEQRRREKRVVRLIPVSAIGRQFATIDQRGHMVKRPDGRLRPINVEVPLCAVIPDLFGQIEAELAESVEQRIAAESKALARLTPAEAASAVGKFLGRPAGLALRVAADLAIGRNAFSDRIADVFLDWVGRPFDDKMRGVDLAVQDAHHRADQTRRAQGAVLEEFREMMIVLRHELPAGDLTGGGFR